MSYFANISYALRTTRKGLALTLKYFFSARFRRNKKSVAAANYFDGEKGTFTVQYPKEEIPVPDNGRYKLHNEIDDCIVCDKCAKICPVDCIDIEPIRAVEEYGKTSDGTSLRIHAAKFDIDMAKCCFCGLCTVVCPTECLTMTDEFDYSTSNILDHNFSFGKMTEKEIAEKRSEFDEFQAKKEMAKGDSESKKIKPIVQKNTGAKPVFKPRPIPKRK
ncbi:MAG: 4Fe-4S dicluster domain-containing protein [Cyclobacteriaceae bacterium]